MGSLSILSIVTVFRNVYAPYSTAEVVKVMLKKKDFLFLTPSTLLIIL